jgi:hypothetical protein
MVASRRHNVNTSAMDAATACFEQCTEGIDSAAVQNEQEEEIESMDSAAEVDTQATKAGEAETDSAKASKRAKLDTCEASLKSASAQIVVLNTLTEYARCALLCCFSPAAVALTN